MALGLTQPLTEMSTRNISWGVKVAGAYCRQPYHHQVPIVWKSGSLYLLEPSGSVQACNGTALPLTFMNVRPHTLQFIYPGPVHVRIVVDKVPLGQFFFKS